MALTKVTSNMMNPPVVSVASKTGAVLLDKGDVGLSSVDNTSDANKPVSTAQQAALNGKVDTTSQQIAKAWVNFNGTGTVAIRTSYNVSSITDVAVGRYTVNYTTALPTARCALATAGSTTAGAAYLDARISGAPTASGVTVSSHIQNSGNPTYSDVDHFNVLVMD